MTMSSILHMDWLNSVVLIFCSPRYFITKDFEIIFDTNESDNRFILQRRFDAIIASFSS